MSRVRICRYVRFADIDAYIELGWYFDGGQMHMPHGAYSVILEWLCDCFPIEPIRDVA